MWWGILRSWRGRRSNNTAPRRKRSARRNTKTNTLLAFPTSCHPTPTLSVASHRRIEPRQGRNKLGRLSIAKFNQSRHRPTVNLPRRLSHRDHSIEVLPREGQVPGPVAIHVRYRSSVQRSGNKIRRSTLQCDHVGKVCNRQPQTGTVLAERMANPALVLRHPRSLALDVAGSDGLREIGNRTIQVASVPVR